MPVRLPPDLMVSVSGFRGRVGAPLTPELVASLAAAFGAFVQEESARDRVYLGRDSRTSGPMFADAARAGLVSVGCGVVDLGVVPTPTLLLAAEDGDAAGALGVTASHNPAEWNALKFAGGDGLFLDAAQMDRFKDFLASEEAPRAGWDVLREAESDPDAVERHINRILELPFLDVDAVQRRSFHVALDCVHGAGGEILPRLLGGLGCRVSGIGLEPDGRFPRDPEPRPRNLTALGELVRESGAELGFAVDPDVDRLALVDDEGRPLGEELTLALSADTVLAHRPGPVVANLSTSRIVEDVAAQAGVACHRAPVGEVNVARRMEAEGAAVGGEGNGGVILPRLHLTRDAPLAVALILQHLVERECTLREAANRWPSYHMVKEKAPLAREGLADAYGRLSGELRAPEENFEDGLRLDWPEAREWLHVRPSGTEPVVRFIAEAPTRRAAERLVERARAIVEG